MDVKNEFDFQKYYENEYNSIISNYYEMLKGKKVLPIIFRIIFGVVISTISLIIINKLNLKAYLDNYYTLTTWTYFATIIVSTLLSIYKYLNDEMVKINEYIFKDLLAFISGNELDQVMYEPKKKVSEEAFDKMELFNLDIVKYNGRNYIKVPYKGNNMVFSDMHTYVYDISEIKKEIYKNGKKYIRTIKKKKKRTILEGMYIGATLNKKNTNHIYLIPNNINDTILQSKIMSYIKYHGVPVMLENLEFSKKYKVFCDDEVQARYILSLSLMEKINEIDNLFKGKKYIVFKEGKRFAICIEGLTIEKIMKTRLPIFRKETKELEILTSMFKQFNNLFKIYHILDLGDDLYTKHIDNINSQNGDVEKQQKTRVMVGGTINTMRKSEESLTDRDKLINSMQLPSNIRSLSKEEQNEVIIKTIIKANGVLKNIQCDNSEYELSNRQKATKNNTLNNIKVGEFLEAYYEITDFVDNYGDNHNGKVFETEKQEIYNLIKMLYNHIKK